MRLKAHMIQVDYGPDSEPDSKELLVKEIRILDQAYYTDGTILGEDDKDSWYSFTHYRGKVKNFRYPYYQLGFQIIDLKEDEKGQDYTLAIAGGGDSSYHSLSYDDKTNIYFDKSKGKVKNGKISFSLRTKDEPVGLKRSGIFSIDIVDSAGMAAYTSPPVHVLPSSMSYEDYKEMIDDLLKIKDDLVVNKDAKLGFEGNWHYRHSSIVKSLEKISRPLKRINQNPKVSLEATYKKESFNSIKSIQPRTLIERELMPFKTKYHIQTPTESVDIYENRMIKFALNKLKDKVTKYASDYESETSQRKAELIKAKEKLESQYGQTIEEKVAGMDRKIQAKEDEIADYKKIYLETSLKNINNMWKCLEKPTGDINVYFKFNKELEIGKNQIKVNLGCRKCTMKITGYKKEEDYYLNLRRGEYRYQPENSTKRLDAIFYANNFALQIETTNLNEIMFFIEQIVEGKCSYGQDKISIHAQAYRVSDDYNDPLGGERLRDYGAGNIYKDYNIRLTKIYTINGAPVPEYELEDITKRLLYYVDEDKLVGLDKLEKELVSYCEEKSLVGSVTNQLNIENNKKESFLNHNKNWEYVNHKIDSFLALDIFKDLKNVHCRWNPTQIFVRDSNYSVVYKSLRGLDYKIDFISEFNSKKFAVTVTHEVYEYWCFFKMIQILINEQKWDLENNDDIVKWLYTHTSRPHLTAKLSHELPGGGKITLTIHNNKEILLKLDKSQKRIPDYTLIFNNGRGEKIVYIDAKYRNYTQQQTSHWDDVKETAIDKYTNEALGGEHEPMSSFIVHSDTDVNRTHYGGDLKGQLAEKLGWVKEPKHRFGTFSFVPSETENFRTFFKMIMEYHLGLHNCCWNCGEIAHSDDKISLEVKKTARGYSKYHYTCHNCGVFWVKNHCLENIGHPLIKHVNNYHSMGNHQGNPWYVHCPRCAIK